MEQTPWQRDRNETEKSGSWPKAWGPFHRHFGNDAVHRDGNLECSHPGTPRRVYVFDPDFLDEHERSVARYAIGHPEMFGDRDAVSLLGYQEIAKLAGVTREYVYRLRKACPEFPEPVAELVCGTIWERAPVVKFLAWYASQPAKKGRPRWAGRAIAELEEISDERS